MNQAGSTARLNASDSSGMHGRAGYAQPEREALNDPCCRVPCCSGTRYAQHPVCTRHWDKLPGKERNALRKARDLPREAHGRWEAIIVGRIVAREALAELRSLEVSP